MCTMHAHAIALCRACTAIDHAARPTRIESREREDGSRSLLASLAPYPPWVGPPAHLGAFCHWGRWVNLWIAPRMVGRRRARALSRLGGWPGSAADASTGRMGAACVSPPRRDNLWIV